LPGEPVTAVVPLTGGTLEGWIGVDVGVHFPAGVSETPLEVTLEEVDLPPATGGFRLLGQIFSITALDPEQNPVTHFDNFFEIVIHYEEEQVAAGEDGLTLYYWNTSEERWIGIAGVVNKEANTLTATLDHLTIFALLKATHQQIYLPDIQR
jgi:hypothetical protein